MDPNPKPIRVLLVSDDPALRETLSGALPARNFVLLLAPGGEPPSETCGRTSAEVVVIDALTTDSEGFDAVQDIMALRPTPILVLTDAVGSRVAFEALSLGALDVMARPGRDAAAGPDFARDLGNRLRLLSGVRVIKHVRGRRWRNKNGPSSTPDGPPVVGIAASLGGPRALAVLLRGLPQELPAPVCVVQHISAGFEHGLAAWLAGESGQKVSEAVDGEPLRVGRVLVAPANAHLTVGTNSEVVLETGPALEGFRPSATMMFRSLAQRFGPRCVGVVLTGMGRDGADGLVALREAGGRTIAQNEATSVVYGMPRAAVEAGAVERVLPLDEIAGAVVQLVREIADPRRPR